MQTYKHIYECTYNVRQLKKQAEQHDLSVEFKTERCCLECSRGSCSYTSSYAMDPRTYTAICSYVPDSSLDLLAPTFAYFFWKSLGSLFPALQRGHLPTFPETTLPQPPNPIANATLAPRPGNTQKQNRRITSCSQLNSLQH